MALRPLAADLENRLKTAPLTYHALGATATTCPQGYRRVHVSRLLERRDYAAAVDDLLTWQVHQRAGLQVFGSRPRATPGAVVQMRLGAGPLSLRIPCRVVYEVSEPDRSGFAYGTLAGHPESGEELFLLQRQEDGRLVFSISAFSRPARLYARVGGPATRWVQGVMTRRYLAALDQLGRVRPAEV